MKKQYKLLLLFFILTNLFKSYSQDYDVNLSPEGKLEIIYDNQGNQFKLEDILINAPIKKKAPVRNELTEFENISITNTSTTNLTCSGTSYFNLYFEPGCGMEDTTNPTHNARRAVLCKVFEDISNFITSPLSNTGNKVNIWVRNIANLSVPSGTLGIASSYYLPSPNGGGILDGEIWKTIHLGVDSYTNVANGTNLFYHGRIAFNFNDPNINWNTNLSINSPSNLYDLYTVILHEVVHSLGFNSFINENGASIDPLPYYSRYDTFLRTNNNIPLLTFGSCNMYDISFNSTISPSVLRPSCTLPDNISNGVQNITNCNNTIKYVGASTVPVYTPTCFEPGSSLSHFEDMLYPTCASPYGNDNYFVLSNAITTGKTKRYLRPEERNVLCDIGYNVNTTFGTDTTSNGFYNYGGTACNGITVAGLNDGINSNGDYTFIGNANSNITISGAIILNNDVNATGFECLQDISANSTLSATSGSSSTTINFSSATTGLHLLRYVPINGTKRGNITYVYVYIRVPANIGGCTPTPSACNLVMNGDFEQFSTITATPIIKKACGWDSVYQLPPGVGDGSAVAKYFSSTGNSTFSNSWKVPCNWHGNQSSNNNIGNSYAGLSISTGVGGKQHIYTRLSTPLQPNTNYQLSFDVSLADGYSHWASNLQAFLHRSNATPPSILAYNSNGDVSIVNNATDTTTQLISPTVTRNTNGWDTITFNFTTTTGGEQFLYLGLLNNATLVSNTPAATGIGGCIYQSAATNAFGNKLISYYIDNVSLIPTNGAELNLPESICNAQNLNDLSIYLSGTTANGVFSGNGVSFANGVYSFNASVAGVGATTIGYTYTNSSGCSVTLYDTINVSTTSANSNTVNAVNDNFTSNPINSSIGGVTTSVYMNDLFNNLPSTINSASQVAFELVAPLSISGATINNSGYIDVPAGTPAGSYTLTYKIKVIGNCNAFSTATVQILVIDNNTTPTIVPGIRANDTVLDVEFQSNGKMIITGNFTRYNNILRNRITRLNTDLTLDTSFYSSGSNGVVPTQDLAVQSDNKIILVGQFSQFNGVSNLNNIARLLPDGGIDTSFNIGGAGISGISGVNGNIVYAVAIQPDGKILVAGDFNYYNGIQRYSIVRLNIDGTVDTSFSMPSPYGYKHSIHDILLQADGKIVLFGYFGFPNNNNRVIRLLSDGSIDASFTQGNLNGSIDHNQIGVGGSPISKLIAQPDGKILIVGAFTKYNSVNTNCIVRLNTNGTVDTSFMTNVGVDRKILEVMLESGTNKILIGGEFTSFNGNTVKKIIRLNTNGTHDTSFSIGSGTTDSVVIPNCPFCRNQIWVLKQQPDSKIVVGGSFTTFNGLSAMNITRIYGNAGVQAKSNAIEYHSEPEIDTNPIYNELTIYPNPSKGIYTIDLTQIQEPTTITIYNVLGELVYDQLLTPQNQNQIDLTHLANGYYIAQINNHLKSIQQKLIKN